MKTPRMKRGVMVDAKGNFLGAFQWDEREPAPKVNAPKTAKAAQARLLTSAEATADPLPGGRWSEKQKRWIAPGKTLWIVDERTGDLRGSRRVFADTIPALQPGLKYVDVAPPESRGRKPVWTGTEWVFPRRVGIVDGEGRLVNVVLENPLEETENVSVPEGCRRAEEAELMQMASGQE